MRALKLKVCGMKFPTNIKEVAAMGPDYMGFIFYEGSPRFMGHTLDPEQLKQLPKNIRKIGVFVNHPPEEIQKLARDYQLDLVQLHGDESAEECRSLAEQGLGIVKAFRIGGTFNFNVLEPYMSVVKYFLFDSRGPNYGGNGTTFNWQILNNYKYEKPFFLSGGLSLEHLEQIRLLSKKQLFALDVNSGFEQEPGLKDLVMLKKLQLAMGHAGRWSL